MSASTCASGPITRSPSQSMRPENVPSTLPLPRISSRPVSESAFASMVLSTGSEFSMRSVRSPLTVGASAVPTSGITDPSKPRLLAGVPSSWVRPPPGALLASIAAAGKSGLVERWLKIGVATEVFEHRFPLGGDLAVEHELGKAGLYAAHLGAGGDAALAHDVLTVDRRRHAGGRLLLHLL